MSDEILDNILDIQPDLTKRALEESKVPAVIPAEDTSLVPENSGTPANPEKAIDNDLAYSRNKLKQIIDSAQITLENAIAVAEETSEPRAFEVVGSMIASIVQANRELMQLHKTKADAQKAAAESGAAAPTKGDTIIEKAVFVGRAQDLLRELKQIRKIEVEQES